MEKETILNCVKNYNNNDYIRFHMPGHKGRDISEYFKDFLGYDLTELKTTDNLYDPEAFGVVEKSFEYVKKIYNSENVIFSAGGATLCLQAAVTAAVRKTGTNKIYCDRRCHKSVINTFVLCGIEPIWIDSNNIKLDDNTVKIMVITSPDYYGYMCDIKKISEMCEAHGIILICDNSHGAHLIFHNNGELHPCGNGADIVIDSLHKTIPSLTGAAVLHFNNKIGTELILSSLRLFASTSPSYLVSTSIIAGISYMDDNRDKFDDLLTMIREFKINAVKSGYHICGSDLYDPYRICINIRNADKLYDFLYDNKIVCEFADSDNLVIIPSIMNLRSEFDILLSCLEKYEHRKSDTEKYPIIIPQRAMTLREAVFSEYITIDINDAERGICAEIYTPYPPGIPVIMPGEIFDKTVIEVLKKNKITHVKIVKER